MDEPHLTGRGAAILVTLLRQPGKTIPQAALHVAADIPRTTAAAILPRLAAAGWVTVTAGPVGSREVTLTPAGEETAKAAAASAGRRTTNSGQASTLRELRERGEPPAVLRAVEAALGVPTEPQPAPRSRRKAAGPAGQARRKAPPPASTYKLPPDTVWR